MQSPKYLPVIKSDYADKIDWYRLSHNLNIMEFICDLDYEAMKQSIQSFAEELAAYVFHPLRMDRIAKRNNIPFDVLITEIY
jgi:hypothetical protein